MAKSVFKPQQSGFRVCAGNLHPMLHYSIWASYQHIFFSLIFGWVYNLSVKWGQFLRVKLSTVNNYSGKTDIKRTVLSQQGVWSPALLLMCSLRPGDAWIISARVRTNQVLEVLTRVSPHFYCVLASLYPILPAANTSSHKTQTQTTIRRKLIYIVS